MLGETHATGPVAPGQYASSRPFIWPQIPSGSRDACPSHGWLKSERRARHLPLELRPNPATSCWSRKRPARYIEAVTRVSHQARTVDGSVKVEEVMQRDVNVEVEMNGRKTRTRRVPTSTIKPFRLRTSDLRHPMAEEFAQHV